MSRFSGLKDDLSTATAPMTRSRRKAVEPPPPEIVKRPGRAGKKGVLGHFSPELSKALHILAIQEGTTMQALMGEAFDLLMRSRGLHPFGER